MKIEWDGVAKAVGHERALSAFPGRRAFDTHRHRSLAGEGGMALNMKLKVRPKSSGRLGCSPSSLVKLIYFSMNYRAKDCGRSSSVVLLLGNYVLCVVPIHMIPR